MGVNKQEEDAETRQDNSDQSYEALEVVGHGFEAFPHQAHFEELGVLWGDTEDFVSDCAEVLTSDEQLLKSDLTDICTDYPVKILSLFLRDEYNVAEEVQTGSYLQ